jgi:archaellum component FlaC
LAKAVSEIKDSVADSLGDLAAVVKGIADQVAEMKKSLDGVHEEVTVVKGNVEEFGERVDAVEADTAVRKSGDLGGIVQEEKTEKSMWGGRFLKSADLYR